MSRTRFLKITAILFLLAVNLFLLFFTWQFSTKYPLSRIILDNKVHHSTSILNNDGLYGATITAINHEPLPSKKVLNYFRQLESVTSVTFKTAEGTKHVGYSEGLFNTDLFIFAFFFILLGNIHFIWGITVFFVNQIYASAKYYARFSLSLGLIFFAFLYLLLSENQIPLILSSYSFFYQIVKMIIEISPVQKKVYVSRLILSIFTIPTIIIAYKSREISPIPSAHIFTAILLFLGLLFAIAGLKRNKKNRFRSQAVRVIVGASLIGIMLPFLFFIITLNFDFPVPLYLTSLLSVITPVVIGRNFVEESQINEFITQRVYSIKFLYDLLLAIITATVLSITLISTPETFPFFLIGLTPVLAFLFALRGKLTKHLRSRSVFNRLQQTSSLQHIIEESINAEAIEVRVHEIIATIKEHLDIDDFKMAIFPRKTYKTDIPIHEAIQIFTHCNEITDYYSQNRDIIKRDILFNSKIEEYMLNHHEWDHFYLIAPVLLQNKVVAVILLGEKNKRLPYFSQDFDYIGSCGTILYQMIENEMLLGETRIAGKYEKELDTASYIQMRIFPLQNPMGAGFEMSIYSRPFNKVTGDYFDIIKLDENNTAIFIGDITGHGLPAAMVNSTCAALINGHIQHDQSLVNTFTLLNSFFTDSYKGNELITLFGGIYNKEERKLRYINAGHPLPKIMRNHGVEDLRGKGPMPGILDRPEYKEREITFGAKDQLLLYTDGFTEIQMINSEQDIGESYFEGLLQNSVDYSIDKKHEYFINIIDSFPQENIKDDITLAFFCFD